MKLYVALNCVLAALLGLGHAQAQAQAQAQENVQSPAAVVGRDDSLVINAFHAEEISRSWRVSSSGYLDLPMVGRVKAEGMTIEQLEVELIKRLRKYVKEPNVSITISDYRSTPVTFTGAVERPGTIQLQGRRRLFEAMMMAGGFKANAATLTLTRRKEAGRIPLPSARETADGVYWVARLAVEDVRTSRGAAANIEVMPSDVVDVELERSRLIYIIGEVTKPGQIELTTEESIPLTKALAIAGGTTRLARTKNVMLRKINEVGESSEVAEVNVKKIYSGKAMDLPLTAGYVVVVASNESKAYLQAASMAAINASIFAGLNSLAY